MNRNVGLEDKMAQLMEINIQTAGNVNAVSQQMGILNIKVDGLRQDVDSIKERMQTFEDTQRVDRSQATNLRSAIHLRVNEVLKIHHQDGIVADECIETDTRYGQGFISRLYADARKYSRLGTPYYDTARKDYLEVLDYIHGWAPTVGVDGYKEYLDKRKKARRVNGEYL